MGNFDYFIPHVSGKKGSALDTLSIVCNMIIYAPDINKIREQLRHPGVARLSDFVRTKNLFFSLDDVKRVCSKRIVCTELKPR